MKKFFSALLTIALVLSLITVTPVQTTQAASVPGNANLLNTYGSLFGHVGTCVTPNQWNDSNTRNFIKGQYNSITMENEMKPDAVLRQNTISVAQAKSMGYNIPSNYTESTVPTLNFNTIDSMMKNAHDNGIQIRYHVLVWHSQTPDWFFRGGYGNGGYVSKSQMNARMEFYIRSVMDHVMNSPYADTVYSWDVVNEYLHASNSGWLNIYGAVNTRPDFVKLAFQIAHDELKKFNKQDSVSLFYNDYNTYMEVDKIISMVNWINSNGKICDGVGMQSHLSSNFPSPDYFKAALDKFVAQGYEVQITELDAKGNNDTDQANYYYKIMSSILSAKKAGGNITAVIWWGLHDGASWRRGENPLLFSSLGVKKQSYNSVLQAYFDAGFSVGDVTTSTNPSTIPTTKTPTIAPSSIAPSTGKIADGQYYIKNVMAQKYLQVANNTGANAQNVELYAGTGEKGQKWNVINNADGTVTIKSALGDYSLDVANGSDEDGANVQIYTSWNGDAQKFYIRETTTSGVYNIATKAGNGTKFLDGADFGTENGTNVQQYSQNGRDNQRWIFEPVNGGSQQTTTPTTVVPTNQPTVTPTSQVTNQPAGDSTAIAKAYMAKMNLVNRCPSGADTKQAGTQYGTVTKKSYFSTTTQTTRQCNVILPANYSTSKKYPVMYLLHGIGGNEDSMVGEATIAIPANLAKQGKAKEFIIVCPNHYAPAPGTATNGGFNQATFDGYDNFINDLTKDLMPYIAQNYSIATGRENTAICGFSMGGRNALYIGYSRPDLFGYVGAFSPAPGVTPGNDFAGMHKGLFTEDEFRIKDTRYVPYVTFISCGTNDSVVGTFPKSYHEILTRNNQPHVWVEVPGADHDNTAISAGYYNFVSAAFGQLGLAGQTTTTPTVTPGPTSSPVITPSPSPVVTPTPTPVVSDTPVVSGVTCEYKVVGDWGNTFQADIVITNKSGRTLNGWTFTCDYNNTIQNLWGAELVSQTGTKVIVKNPSWDANLADGQSVTISFIGNGTASIAPTNMSVK